MWMNIAQQTWAIFITITTYTLQSEVTNISEIY